VLAEAGFRELLNHGPEAARAWSEQVR